MQDRSAARVYDRKFHVCHGTCTQSEIIVTAEQDCLHICPASFLSQRMEAYCKRAAQDCLHICLARLVLPKRATFLQKSGARHGHHQGRAQAFTLTPTNACLSSRVLTSAHETREAYLQANYNDLYKSLSVSPAARHSSASASASRIRWCTIASSAFVLLGSPKSFSCRQTLSTS